MSAVTVRTLSRCRHAAVRAFQLRIHMNSILATIARYHRGGTSLSDLDAALDRIDGDSCHGLTVVFARRRCAAFGNVLLLSRKAMLTTTDPRYQRLRYLTICTYLRRQCGSI
jgi:hypothetical protein